MKNLLTGSLWRLALVIVAGVFGFVFFVTSWPWVCWQLAMYLIVHGYTSYDFGYRIGAGIVVTPIIAATLFGFAILWRHVGFRT